MSKFGGYGDIEERGFDPDIAAMEVRFKKGPIKPPETQVEYLEKTYTTIPCLKCEKTYDETSETVKDGIEELSQSKLWVCECGWDYNLMTPEKKEKT